MKFCTLLACAASAMLLQSCSSEPTNRSLIAIAATSDRIVADMAPLIYDKLGTPPEPSKRRRAVALVFTQFGKPPPNATCIATLKVAFERQLRTLEDQAGIDLGIGPAPEKAAVVFVLGDTVHTDSRSPRLQAWMLAARRSAPYATSEFSESLWIPGHFSADFLQGIYADPADRLVFGVSLVHWAAMKSGPNGEGCAINFIERLAHVYSLALKQEFTEAYARIGREARASVGPIAYDVSSEDAARFELGLYLCAQFVDRMKLGRCAQQMVRLAADNDRN